MVRFDVDRIEARGGRLVVSGFWSGVRGMRFMRPTLIVGDREVLATLDHKPWTPSDELPWTAAFPWDEAAPDPEVAAIAVAPSVTVPLAPDAEPSVRAKTAKPPSPARTKKAAPAKAPVPEAASPEPPSRELADLGGERDRLRAELEAARRRARQAEAARDEARHARTTAEREREHAIAQRDEAAKDRDAAIRARARMEAQLEDQIAQRADAEAARESAVAQCEEARAQREEALLAHRTLQRRLDAALAERPQEELGGARFSRPRPEPHDDPDRPIGVRTIPAARAVGPELHRAGRPARRPLTLYDVWAIRILGSVAALCFIGFLILLLRLVL